MNIFIIVIVTFIISSLSVGGGYLLWLRTRPHKETWVAKVYRLSEGVHNPVGKRGEIISNLKLNDLVPYFIDIAEKVQPGPGVTIHRLQKLNKAIPAITSDCVEQWGSRKEINLVEIKGSFYLLKKGFNKQTGDEIFNPLPVENINLVESEMALRERQYGKEKSILEAISPWVVTALLCLTVIAGIYVNANAFSVMSENYKEASIKLADTLDHINTGRGAADTGVKIVKQKPVNKIPSIENVK